MILFNAVATEIAETTLAVENGSLTKVSTDFIFHLIEFAVILALMILAIFLGAKLRKATDALKAKKEAAKDAANSDEKE